MVVLEITHRSLLAYRHSLLVNETTWITTRTQLYHLDLAVPNEVLFGKHFEQVFPDIKVDSGELTKCNVSEKQIRFHLDDISVGCDGRRGSNLFYLYAASTYRKVDRLGMGIFIAFLNYLDVGALPLAYGENAVRFLNLVKFIDLKQWRERVMPDPTGDRCLLVDAIFRRIYPSILKGIYKKKSEHPLLLKEFWDECCSTIENLVVMFMNVPDAEHLKLILDVGNILQFDFWGIKSGQQGLAEFIIIDYCVEKRYDHINLLLDYGFSLGVDMTSDDAAVAHCVDDNQLIFSLLDYASTESIPNYPMVRILVRFYEMSDDETELEPFIELYQKLSLMLPMPSLPSSVVRMHLLKAFGPSFLEEVEEMIHIYEACEVHPSDDNKVTPQSLSHLSFCAFRNQLAATYQLPAAMGYSHIPNLFKQFLSLDL